MDRYPDINKNPKDKDEASFESRHKAAILLLTIVFVGLVAYAAIGGW